jgi:SAM-dependent methyltransferase
MLIERWLPAPVGSVLKTDLFDELVAPGLYPVLRSRGDRVVAVDISPEVVDGARERHPGLDAQVATITKLPFSAGSFDAVLSNSTLDHLATEEEVTAALSELARVIRPAGRLLITLDNPLNPLIALREALPVRIARAVRRVPYDSGWTCGPRQLRRMLAECGFVAPPTTAIMHAPRVLIAELDRRGNRSGHGDQHLLAGMLAAERLERWPTRYLTGHFIAALAIRS